MGLQAYYRFNGNSNDAIGSYNGTDYNMTYNAASGVFNSGAKFTRGSTTYITSSVPAIGSDPCTISVLFKSAGGATYGYHMLSWVLNGYSNRFLIEIYDTGEGNASGAFSCYTVGSGKEYYRYSEPIRFDDNKWHMAIVRIYSSTNTLTIDLDGKPVTGVQSGASMGTINTNSTLRIGRTDDSNNRYFDGCLDELKIEKRLWSNAECKNEYARIKGFF